MKAPDRRGESTLPDPVESTLTDFETALGLSLRLVRKPANGREPAEVLYRSAGFPDDAEIQATSVVHPRDGRPMILEIARADRAPPDAVAGVLAASLDRALEADREVRFFTFELSERYEEINLLYSISEILGSILHLDDAARVILGEVCSVMGARRGSLWVHDVGSDQLQLTASVGAEGLDGPLSIRDPDTVTAMVFRDGIPVIASRMVTPEARSAGAEGDSFLSVPIRYTPPAGQTRTVGVINLIGRNDGDRFSGSDQKLLSAIASQVGAALENNRLIQESLSKERMAREMELAHDLQMKLLPDAARFDAADAAARVSPAEQVGGDFYQLFKLGGGRVGVMLGDVSLHGFPSALIMTLTMSAAGIYAREHDSPARVIREMDDALRDELETTEMFLTMFYGVIDPQAGTLTYANAGHPHAFSVHGDGSMERLAATDPPVGFAGPDSYAETCVPWSSGSDLLLLFTDGLSDMLSTGSRNDGEGRVLDTVASHRERPAGEIVEALFSLASGVASPIMGDDRTALVLRA